MAQYKEKLLKDKLDYLEETKALIKNVLQELGADVSDEDTFRDYVNILGTLKTGDVLLFSTVEEMNAYPNPPNGKYAVVYQQSKQSLGYIGHDCITFPESVVLGEEITVTYSGKLYHYITFNVGTVTLTPDTCSIVLNMDDMSLNVSYESIDGIHYVRTTLVNNGFDEINGVYILPDKINFHSTIPPQTLDNLGCFIKCIIGDFNGLYMCVDGVFVTTITQLNLRTPNQLLNNYSGYGRNNIVNGDGTYITNIPVTEYMRKYLPKLNQAPINSSVIQYGTQIRPMEFVQRNQLKIDDAFTENYPQEDAIVQLANMEKVSVNVPNEYKTLIQNYLNAQVRYNYEFLIDNKAYVLYIGYNYSTTQIQDEGSVFRTVPYQVTSVYGFILDLEDLSIYKTFENTDTWLFTDAGFGNVLLFGYSVNDDSIILVCDTNGWGLVDGAHICITKIQADTGVRNTNYYTPNFSGDYEYKSIAYVSYNSTQDCYYLAYRTSMSGNGGNNSIKRICKLTSDGIITSVFESVEKMENLPTLWTHYLQDNGSLLYYKTATKGDVLRNLENNIEITLYGSTIEDKEYWVQDINNIYVSHKINPNDSVYNVCAIDKATLNATIIPNTESSSRITKSYFRYNNDLCIFRNNEIISLQGNIVGYNIVYGYHIQGISGITKVNDYMYKSLWIDNQLQISNNKISAGIYKYMYYDYSDIKKFPLQNDICFLAYYGNDRVTNDSMPQYKYMSIPLTDVTRGDEQILDRIAEL